MHVMNICRRRCAGDKHNEFASIQLSFTTSNSLSKRLSMHYSGIGRKKEYRLMSFPSDQELAHPKHGCSPENRNRLLYPAANIR